ncbi:MAG TPA: iron uptake porin [Oculatellaceae cyanobacterium]
MTSRRVALLLAGSIFLTGATGAFVGSMTSAHAITAVDELTDVNQNHWAYDALRDLVEKYDVIEGYPDHTFRGNRTATRWELAAALNALIKSVGRDLARLGAEKADKSDLETLARLQDEFKNELAALQARTSALESRAAAIEAKNEEQDQRLSLLERTQIHGDMSFGILADMNNGGIGRAGSTGKNGITDGISAIGRLRLAMDIPVKEDKEDSKVGAGEVHTRMIAAFGRWAPSGAQDNNFGAFGSFNGYSRIASDAAAGNEGLGASTLGNGLNGGTNLRSYLYVEDVHYHQHFKSGIPLLSDFLLGAGSQDSNWATTGDLYVGSMPWRYLFDKSPYRGNELNQFQNTAFVNTPGIAVNQNYPMIAYQWHQKLGSDNLSADLTTGIGSMDIGNTMDGLNLTYEARLNYNYFNRPGSVYVGGYNIWNVGSRSASKGWYNGNFGTTTNGVTPVNQAGLVTGTGNSGSSTNALYLGWNQEWYKGIGTTFNYFLSNGSQNNFFYSSNNQLIGAINGNVGAARLAVAPRQSVTGVLSIPMNVFGIRENDVIGIGYSALELYGNGASRPNAELARRLVTTWEQVVEAYYKWAVNDAISIVPSVQFINGGFGVEQNKPNVVIGLRTSYSF